MYEKTISIGNIPNVTIKYEYRPSFYTYEEGECDEEFDFLEVTPEIDDDFFNAHLFEIEDQLRVFEDYPDPPECE